MLAHHRMKVNNSKLILTAKRLRNYNGNRNDRNKVIYLPDISVCKTNLLRGLKKKSEYNYKTTVTYMGLKYSITENDKLGKIEK